MPRVYFAMEVLHRGFLSCLELLLSSKLQVREKIRCKVLERVCDGFKCGCEYVGQH